MGNETEGYFTVRSLEPFFRQVVEEMVASRKKDEGVQGFSQNTRKTGLHGF